jgi:hypothetical protein
MPKKTINLDHILDFQDPKIKEELLHLIAQYLRAEGFHTTVTTLQDESHLRLCEDLNLQQLAKKIKKAILGSLHSAGPKGVSIL